MTNQKGAIHFILLLAIIGIIAIMIVANAAPFKNGFLSSLYPKDSSFAAEDFRNNISSLTDQLLQEKTKGISTSTIGAMASIASQRASQMKRLASVDPAEFINQAKLVGKNGEFPSQINSDLEKYIEVKGTLIAVHGDDFTNKKSGPIDYFIQNPTISRSTGFVQAPKSFKVNFVKPPSSKALGSKVSASGFAIGNNLVIETGDPSGTRSNLKVESLNLSKARVGDMKTAVFLINFENENYQRISKDEAKDLMFNKPNSVNKFYQETSYNKVSFSGDVFGYYTIPAYTSGYCEYWNWSSQAEQKARDQGVPVDSFAYKVFVFPSSSVCGYGGLGEIGSGDWVYQSWIFVPDNGYVYKHELGHNLGVHHANALGCTEIIPSDYSKCTSYEYYDFTDVMGYQEFQFNGPHKVSTGWIPSVLVASSSASTYDIYNTEQQTDLPQVIKISSPYITTDYGSLDYYLSYRRPLGVDKNLATAMVNGVSIHLWANSPFDQTKLVDATPQSPNGVNDASLYDGGTFVDNKAQLRVKQISHSDQKATVEVSYGTFPKGIINRNTEICYIPPGKSSCTTKITWNTSNATNVTVKNRETSQIFATDPSGSKDAEISDMSTFDLYSNNELLASVVTYASSPPPKPTVTMPKCIDPNYAGDGIKINWPLLRAPVNLANLATQPTYYSDRNTPSKYVYPETSTVAPSGYYDFDRQTQSYSPVKLQPNITYYIWLTSTMGDGEAASFSLNKCGAVFGDFDGDKRADMATFRPSTGGWAIKSRGGDLNSAWGGNGDIPVIGDYNGDGKMDKAVFRPSNSTWYIDNENPNGTQLGQSGDIPVPGDYNGDGKTDKAIYNNSTGQWQSTVGSIGWGRPNAEAVAVPADYNGDGKVEPAWFLNGTWFIQSSPGAAISWGQGGDIATPADYNGDGKTDIAVFRPSASSWYVRELNQNGTSWGQAGDIPVPADYNGDGKADYTLFRPANGTWYVSPTAGFSVNGVQLGQSGDIPATKRPSFPGYPF